MSLNDVYTSAQTIILRDEVCQNLNLQLRHALRAGGVKIKNLIIKLNKAFRNTDKERYRFLRNRVTNETRKENRIFYKKIKPLRSNDSKSWWNAVKL